MEKVLYFFKNGTFQEFSLLSKPDMHVKPFLDNSELGKDNSFVKSFLSAYLDLQQRMYYIIQHNLLPQKSTLIPGDLLVTSRRGSILTLLSIMKLT